MSPEETITAYLEQRRRRFVWLAVSLGVGLVAAGAWWISGLRLEPWKPGLIAFSVTFWPWFFAHTSRKDYVSTRAAWRARVEAGSGSSRATPR
ncbi:MAG: hypothetical protein M0R80_17140 [Proteobacteria bacterium]|jgi:fatty acid desaturase|nr:hypothetical protein [Pseudomonadota bacterium]